MDRRPYHFPPRRCDQLRRGRGIEEDVERRNLAVANDNYIQAGVVGFLAARAGTPSQPTGRILKSLRLAVGCVNEVRMCGTAISFSSFFVFIILALLNVN
jgi:hypothetical protein